MALEASTLDRTLKIELDDGSAQSEEELREIAASHVLQVRVGKGLAASLTSQAALLTLLNVGGRAFSGGLRVLLDEDPVLDLPWARGLRVSEAAVRFGCTAVDSLGSQKPTVVLGEVDTLPAGSVVLYPTWQGWAAGVLERPEERFNDRAEFPLAGVLAAALATSEAFLHIRGHVLAGRRSIGLSLWRPELEWACEEASGPSESFLPTRAWLLGLGHLGQAYAWALGCLPYPDSGEVSLMLQDYDVIEAANRSTGLLTDEEMVGRPKARAIASRLEAIGFSTSICERPFTANTRRESTPVDEPSLAFGGFDSPVPRHSLEAVGFGLVVDAGLGTGPSSYDQIAIHSFPSGLRAADCFPVTAQRSLTQALDQPAYREMIERRMKDGETETEARCGVLSVAGVSVGVVFVGAAAATLVIAEAMRALVDGPRYQVIDLSLRSPEHRIIVANEHPDTTPTIPWVAT